MEWGLITALREGSLPCVLEELHIGFHCTISGGHAADLSDEGKTLVYRLVCEAVMKLLTERLCQAVRVSVRVGLHRGRAWTALRLDSVALPRTAKDFADRELSHQADLIHLATKLGTYGLSLQEMHQRARVQQGQLRIRDIAEGKRLSLLLHDVLLEILDDSKEDDVSYSRPYWA